MLGLRPKMIELEIRSIKKKNPKSFAEEYLNTKIDHFSGTQVTSSQIQSIATQPQMLHQQQPHQPPQSLQQQPPQQAILQQTVPIIHQPSGIVMQSLAGNLNVPPPTQVLSQPPPNIQLQASGQMATQIVLNPSQGNYQYQYIQPVSDPNQPNQVTIQHIYQPQSIVQTSNAQAIGHFTAQQATLRPQQYIVGNTT